MTGDVDHHYHVFLLIFLSSSSSTSTTANDNSTTAVLQYMSCEGWGAALLSFGSHRGSRCSAGVIAVVAV